MDSLLSAWRNWTRSMNYRRLKLQQLINAMAWNYRVFLVGRIFDESVLFRYGWFLLASVDTMHDIEVEYVTFPGWRGRSTSDCRTFNSLPHNARLYVQFIEQYLGVPGKFLRFSLLEILVLFQLNGLVLERIVWLWFVYFNEFRKISADNYLQWTKPSTTKMDNLIFFIFLFTLHLWTFSDRTLTLHNRFRFYLNTPFAVVYFSFFFPSDWTLLRDILMDGFMFLVFVLDCLKWTNQ